MPHPGTLVFAIAACALLRLLYDLYHLTTDPYRCSVCGRWMSDSDTEHEGTIPETAYGNEGTCKSCAVRFL